MFSVIFDIDVESVPTDVQMEFVRLQDLNLKAKFISKSVWEFYRVPPSNNKTSEDFKTRSKINLFFWKYLSLRTILF